MGSIPPSSLIFLAERSCTKNETRQWCIYLPSKYPLGDVLPEFVADEAICRHCLAIAEWVQGAVIQIVKST